MGKQSSNTGGTAAVVVFTAVAGALLAACIASPGQVHEAYGQVVDGFLHEELDSIRDFVRQPTWAGLRAGVQVSTADSSNSCPSTPTR